jgi:hypothetical protein
MTKMTAWIAILFGMHTVAYAIFARSFVGNAELPLTEDERNALVKKRPSVLARIAGVCLGLAFCAYGMYSLFR